MAPQNDKEKRTFRVGGDIVDVPTSNASAFLADFPDAEELESFIVGEDTVDVPIANREAFLADFPEAKLTYASPEKKSPSGSPSQGGLQGSQDGITVPSGGIEVPAAALPGLGGVERPKEGEWAPTVLKPEEEQQFRNFMTNDPNVVAWAEEFKNNYGEVPDLEAGGYDYRGAWKAGMTPRPYTTPEGNTEYHWGSIGEMGKDLKSPDHPTRWKSDYMQTFGKDPDQEGVSEPVGKFMVGLKSGMKRVMSKVDNEAKEIASGEIIINGSPVSNNTAKKNAYDREFIKGLLEGRNSIEFNNADPYIESIYRSQIEAGGEYDVWKSLKAGLLTAEAGLRNMPVWMNDVLEEATGIDNILFTTVGSISPEARKMAASGEMRNRLKLSAEKVLKAAEAERESKFKIDDPSKGSEAQRDVIDLFNQGKYGEVGRYMLNTTIESGPVMLASAGAALATGNPIAGAAFLVPMSASMNYAETGMDDSAYRKLAEEKGITDREAAENFIQSTRIAKANVSGLAEGVPEALMGKVITNSFKVFSGGVKQVVGEMAEKAGPEAAKRVAEETAKTTATEIVKNFAGATALGGLEEFTTTITNELTDVFLGTSNKTFPKIMRTAFNDGIVGMGSTGIIVGPGAGTALSAKGLQATKKLFDNAVTIDPSFMQDISDHIGTQVEAGRISKSQAAAIEENLAKREKAVKAVPKEKVSDTETVDKVQRKQELQEEMSGLDTVYQEPIKEEIAAIDNELREGIKKESPAPTVNTTPTEARYASVNRNDGKGTVDLTKEEYLAEMERRGTPVEETAAEAPQAEKKTESLQQEKTSIEQKMEDEIAKARDPFYYAPPLPFPDGLARTPNNEKRWREEQEARIKEQMNEAEAAIRENYATQLQGIDEKISQASKPSPATTATQPVEAPVSESELNREAAVNPALKDVESTAKALDEVSVEVPNKNNSLPTSPKTWGTQKELANIIRGELSGAIERGVSFNEWVNKGYSRQLSTWSNEHRNEFLSVSKKEYAKLASEAYHKAKADGSNPELVKAVESLLSKEQTPTQDAVQEQSTESVPVRQQPEARQGVREEDTQGQETPQEGEAVKGEVTLEADAKQELVADEILMSGEAQKRRQEGKYEKDGIIFERNPEKDGPKGSTGNVRFAQGEQEMPFTFRLIEADELQPSHINGRRNPLHFLPEAQPKTRDDAASIKAEDDIAANPRLDLVGEDTGAYSGAPIVNKRGEVVQGNNRAAGLKKTYQRNNPSYKQQIAERAGEFGLTKEQVEGMKNPVLVREVAFSDDAAIKFGNYKAGDLETGGEAEIEPVTVSARMPLEAKQSIIGMMFSEGDGTLKAAIKDNFKRAAEIVFPYLNAAQRNSLTKTTTPSPGQIAKMEGIVLQFLFDGGDPNLSSMFNQLSPTQKAAVLKAAPSLFSVTRDKSLVPEVQSAIGALNAFYVSGIADFDTWTNQSNIFIGGLSPKEIYTPTEILFAKTLAEASKQDALKDVVKPYSELVKGTPETLFAPATEGLTKEEALKKQFNDDTGGKKAVGGATPTMAPKKTDTKADKPTRKRKESKKSRDAKRDKLKQDIKALEDDLWNDLNSLGFAATPDKLGKEAQEFTDKLIKLARLKIEDSLMSLEDFVKEVLSKYTGSRTDVAELSEIAYNAAKDAYIRETAKEMTSTEGRKETDNKFNEAHDEAFEFAEKELSGIMNALVPEDKKGVYQKEKRNRKESLERGKAMIQSGAINPSAFISAILKSPRPLSSDEIAAMVYYKTMLDNRVRSLSEQSSKARENGDVEGVSVAELALNEVDAQIDEYYQFQEATGYEQGHSLGMRQLLLGSEYEIANQVRKYKKATGKSFVPPDVMAKFKMYDEAIRELSERIDEFEKRSEEASESLEILSEPDPDKPKTKSDAAKLFANKVRQKKFVKSAKQLATLQSDPTGLFKFAWDSALEFIATTVEQGGTIADAVDGAIDKLKNSEWYKNLSKKGKDAFENTAKTSLSEEAMEYAGISIPTLIDGFLHIPDSFVKDLIKNGFDTIETATIEARRFLLENLGIEATERQVRDAISDYGKRSKLSKDEVSQKMREMKRVGKLLSALEDVQRKKRPLRSGRERDAMTQKEREIKREINALLKDIPQTSEETDAAWKSALDATKTRLRNRIEDIQKQIAEGKKTPKKKSIELDAEAKYLKEEVDRLNEILRSIEGKPEMTFEQRVRITEQAIERSIQEYERRIREKDFEPMSKEPVSTPEIEALRTKREQLRKQYSEEYSKSPAKDTARDSAAMKRLQKQIDELTEKIHGRISIESKKEAAKEYGAHVKAMQERVKSLRAALMETEQGKAIAEKRALENVKKATARSIQEYERRIREKDFAVKKSKQVALDTEAKALKAEQKKWKNRFDTEREKSRLDERTKTEKLREGLVDIIGVPKSLVASLDFSSVLRQGGLLSAKHPKMAVSATKEMIKQTFSEAAYEKWMDEFIVSDIYNDAKKAGLYIATPNAKLLAKEESFVSNIAEMIPIYGRLVRASNRAYSSYLNVMRIAVFADFQEQIDKSGLSEKDAELAKKDMAAFINNATGRGSLLGYEPNSPELNLLFFSPRFVLSRANIVMNTATGYAAYHPKVRKEALLTVAAYLSAVTTLILLSTMAGADAEDDPRSSDFGKIRTGKLRLDPLAGLSQMVTFFSRMITGQTKSLSTGEVSNLGEGRFGRNRLGVIGSFIRSKMSPAASALVDMADSPAGKTKKWGVPGVMEFENKVYFKNIVGEEQTLPERAISLMTPIYTQGAIEIYQEEGLLMAAAATGADIIGIASQYHSTAGTESTEATLSKSEKELKKEISDFKASVLESMSKEAKGKYIPFEDADLFAGTDVPDRYEEKFSEKYREVYGQQKELPSIDLDGIAKEHNMNVFKETDKKAGTGLAAIFVTGKDADGNSLKPPIKAAASFVDSKKKSLTEKQEKILSDFLNITLEDDSYLSDFKEELKRLQSK